MARGGSLRKILSSVSHVILQQKLMDPMDAAEMKVAVRL